MKRALDVLIHFSDPKYLVLEFARIFIALNALRISRIFTTVNEIV